VYLCALHYSLALGGCNMFPGCGAPGMQEKILNKLAAKLSGWDYLFKHARECLNFK
jgi:hypothetical protein